MHGRKSLKPLKHYMGGQVPGFNFWNFKSRDFSDIAGKPRDSLFSNGFQALRAIYCSESWKATPRKRARNGACRMRRPMGAPTKICRMRFLGPPEHALL